MLPFFYLAKIQLIRVNYYLYRAKNVENIMIEIRGIQKSYGDLQVLKGIDLDIREQEVVTIVGPSGAGKSTLLHLLGTLDTPDAGEIRYDAVNIAKLSPNKLSLFRNHHIGFVFQHHHLLPEFTAIENIAIPAWIKGDGKREAEKRARELLQLLGVAHRAAHKPNELSGGEQQRVSVARALINTPKVVLADEPSGNLDSRNKEELHRLFFSLRERLGQTFVIVTHDPSLAAMADRQIHLRDGMIEKS
jgi:lipoprotein-releasing system ATP-binding protein